MSLNQTSQIISVSWLNDPAHAKTRQRMEDFLKGAVYCWCKNNPDRWFALRDLMGGDNFYWNDTPLMPLYEKHINDGFPNTEAIKRAAQDCGKLLKIVIKAAQRRFDTKVEAQVRQYLWTHQEDNL